MTHSCSTAQAQALPSPCGRSWVYYFYLYQIIYLPVKEKTDSYRHFLLPLFENYFMAPNASSLHLEPAG